jgi:hypothetical protein
MVKGKNMSQFPHGEVFEPERNMYGAPVGPSQMCVTEEILKKIAKRHLHLPRLEWEYGKSWRCSGKSRSGRTILTVRLRNHGWRVYRRFFEEWKGGIPYDLCYAFSYVAAVFPSDRSAIHAAELFSLGQNWEVAPLVWVNRQGEWRFGGANLIN